MQRTDLGEKTFFWYHVYCLVLAFLYLIMAVVGIALIVLQPEGRDHSAIQSVIMGSVYAGLGTVFFVVFVVAMFLPPKPYNWIVGIVMMALGMSSCCMWPFLIPLFIYWVKPETQAFFGRK